MQGFITDANLGQADEVFPGIARYFAACVEKPRTFLELVAQFEHWNAVSGTTRCNRSRR